MARKKKIGLAAASKATRRRVARLGGKASGKKDENEANLREGQRDLEGEEDNSLTSDLFEVLKK